MPFSPVFHLNVFLTCLCICTLTLPLSIALSFSLVSSLFQSLSFVLYCLLLVLTSLPHSPPCGYPQLQLTYQNRCNTRFFQHFKGQQAMPHSSTARTQEMTTSWHCPQLTHLSLAYLFLCQPQQQVALMSVLFFFSINDASVRCTTSLCLCIRVSLSLSLSVCLSVFICLFVCASQYFQFIF